MKPFQIWKTQTGKQELNQWYEKFWNQIEYPIESKTVETRFGKTHLLIAGPEDAPPILALHAMRTGAPFLAKEMGRTLENFRIIAPDLPGQSIKGLQKKLSLTNEEHATWVNEILESLELEKTNVFGVSWGGFVARDFANRHPEKVSKLALMVPAGIANGSHITGLMKMAWPMIRYQFRKTDENLKKLLSPILTSPDPDWEGFIGCSINHMKMDVRIPPLATAKQLESLDMPVLVIGGDQDISFPGDKIKSRISEHCPNAEVEILTNCKHCPPTTPEFRSWLENRLMSFFS